MSAHRFDLGCSPVVFDLDAYAILTRRGHRLQALLDGTAEPRDLNERYFVRCIREDADNDSHQCLEAEAWRQMLERREFETLNPSPGPGRTWVRSDEIQAGVVLLSDPVNPLLFTLGLGVEFRGWPHREYRLATQFPWRRLDEGYYRQTLNLTTGALEEFPKPPKEEMWPALDEPPHELLFVGQASPDDEMFVSDPSSGETFRMPPNQVAHNAAWQVYPYTLVRVQFSAGQPVWVWGGV